MSFLSNNPFEYGTHEFTNQLQLLANRGGWVPYENIHQASVDIFREKYGDGRLVLAQFLEMVLNPESSSEQAMAGWYLLYFSFKQKRAELIAQGCVRTDAQTKAVTNEPYSTHAHTQTSSRSITCFTAFQISTLSLPYHTLWS